jgi:transcription-repair coupling factor (superfamily II helicase)
VENLQLLLGRYENDERVRAVVNTLESECPVNIILQKMVGAQGSFVLSGIFLNYRKNVVVVANSKEEASYLFHNLSRILPKKPVWFFPDSLKKPGEPSEINSHNVMQRSETVNKLGLSDIKAQIIVTYPEALCEKVISPQDLKRQRIIIKVGEQIDLDFLIGILVEYGFENVDFVYEPGQFSVRGGIIDLFSFGNEWPYRIELFDQEIESIRTFNPLDQLSVRQINSLSLVPNMNHPVLHSSKVSMLQILPRETLFWIYDDQFLVDRLQDCFEKSGEWKEFILEQRQGENAVDLPEYLKPVGIMEELQCFSKIFVGPRPNFFQIDKVLEVPGKPQPSFNKNFPLLIENLKSNQGEGITNFLLTDNPRQIQRFDSIFEDLNADVQFIPILISVDKGFIDQILQIACYTDHQIFQRFHKYQIRKGFTRDQALSIRVLRELTPGDFVTHIDHGVGRYSGLEKISINGHLQESVRLIYKNNDILYIGIQSLHKIAKYVGKEGTTPQLSKLGSDTWKNLKRRTKKKVKDIAGELIKLYAERRAAEGFSFALDGYMQNELEASFFYEDTPDQFKATQEVKTDMEQSFPMDRLICGDVGFGKTEIAIRAAFKAVCDGKQVAVLVPTTILALQHFKTFNERLEPFGVSIDYLNRFRSYSDRKRIFEYLKNGKIEIIIGTHGLLNKAVEFEDLGLLIVDEEQKFGVAAKEKLRKIKINVDTLTLTATPIPRTLQFSLMAARDLSIINTPPPNRQPIHTEIRIFSEGLIQEALYYEANRGGQIFFVHNRISNLPDVAQMLQKLCPDLQIASAHGQMDSKSLEKTLVSFIEGYYDVLVCTNIIETGLDIPNVNTIIINNAHQFGLSDLHQLRGRVGRSNRKAFCYLLSPPMSTLTPEARKRLKTIEEFSDLGSGFNIAMRDMDIRGAGNLLGAEQSGFISVIWY